MQGRVPVVEAAAVVADPVGAAVADRALLPVPT
jgi:hypothetical protein